MWYVTLGLEYTECYIWLEYDLGPQNISDAVGDFNHCPVCDTHSETWHCTVGRWLLIYNMRGTRRELCVRRPHGWNSWKGNRVRGRWDEGVGSSERNLYKFLRGREVRKMSCGRSNMDTRRLSENMKGDNCDIHSWSWDRESETWEGTTVTSTHDHGTERLKT